MCNQRLKLKLSRKKGQLLHHYNQYQYSQRSHWHKQRCERRNVQPPGEWWKAKPQVLRYNDDDEGEDAEFVHTSALTGNEPNSYTEAMASPDAQRWHEAALEEISAQLKNGC